MNKVWVTGDAVVDLIPDSENSYLKCPGGAPANVAVAIARLEGKASFLGRVGEDPLGRFMYKILKNEGVDTQKLLLDASKRTSTVIVDLDDSGERSFTFMVKPSADQFFHRDDIPEFNPGEWLHFCSIALANEPSRSATFEAAQSLKTKGGFVSFDLNLREEVWTNTDEIKTTILKAIEIADVVKFSDDELMFLTDCSDLQKSLETLELSSQKLIVITQGAKGALVIFNGQQKLITGTAVTPIDTTGAGDAFVGGMLAQLSRLEIWNEWEVIEKAISWGNACGAFATTQKGAMTALPTLNQLQEVL
ncbi:aminoimidazole riboside kinase [Vibrio cincinnatiensis]|jgi:fructokinase|uniref:aminoimidazole riboside kinase n=1 Tax=Vibrio cincinnatiensis TaxID=675 RepID=UPI001EDDDEF0|nr:aminoimidazole riboside kinase [Vibrio cincinnatiensis]MCG3723795.1 aminoimidazole riboside kinase [Vibrio cincinnatiensis]